MKQIENLLCSCLPIGKVTSGRKIKNYIQLVFFTVIFTVLSLGIVNAQAQEDITKCDFSASSQQNLYIQLNYTCRNVTWLPRAYDVYRRVNFIENGNSLICEDKDGEKATDFDEFWTRDPIGNSLSSDGNYAVEDYLLFYDVADLSKRETVGWFENQLVENGGEISDGLKLKQRNLPRPFYVSDDLVESNTNLSPYKGFVVCPVYDVGENGQYETSPTSYIRADLIPPTVQNLENMFVDAFYLIWGFLGIFGLGMLTYLGFEFIWGGNSPEKLGELRTKFSLWLLGILLVILAPSLINFIYSLVGISTTKCYKLRTEVGSEETVYDLTMPGFTFFFKDVCTGAFPVSDDRGGDQP